MYSKNFGSQTTPREEKIKGRMSFKNDFFGHRMDANRGNKNAKKKGWFKPWQT